MSETTLRLALVVPCLYGSLASASLITSTWTGGATGNWSVAGNWSPTGVPNNSTNTFDVIIDGNAAQNTAVTLNMNAVINTLIIDAGDSLSMANNSDLRVIGSSIVNNGLFSIDSAGNYTQFFIGPSVTISGSGALAMGSNYYNRIVGTAYGNRLINSVGHTISGGGQFGVDFIALSNYGLIDANRAQPLIVDLHGASANDNTGVMQASAGATLQIESSAIDNTDGVVQALNGSSVNVYAATISGGEVTTAGSGVVNGVADAMFANILNSGHIRGINNTNTHFSGTITNNATIELASSGNYTQLLASGSPTTFQGSGEIVMGSNAYNRIGSSTSGTRVVNAAGHTIRGGGALGFDTILMSNAGTIRADEPVSLIVDFNSSAANDNTGVMEAIDGATMQVTGTEIDNSGGMIRALDASRVDVYVSAIRHGDLDTDGSGEIRLTADTTLEDVASSAKIVCVNNTNTYFRDTIVNDGTIDIASTGNFTQLFVGGTMGSVVTLAGGGTLRIGNNYYNRIVGQAYGNRLINAASHTIRGSGQLGVDIINITNQGAIIADTSVGLIIDPNTEFLNQGLLHVTGSGGVQIDPGAFINTGQVTIDATRNLTRHQDYTQTAGTTLVNGTLTMATSGTLALQGGTLKGTGTISGPVSNTAGSIEPGLSAGTLAINGTFAQSGSGRLNIEIGGTAAGAFDVLNVTGAATLGGALDISSINGFSPTLGQSFTILTAGSINGYFQSVSGSGEYCVSYSPTAVTVTVVSPCAADIRCNRQVDVQDLLTVISNWGACANCPPTRCIADIAPIGPPQGDCVVNVADLLAVISHWGPCP